MVRPSRALHRDGLARGTAGERDLPCPAFRMLRQPRDDSSQRLWQFAATHGNMTQMCASLTELITVLK